MIFGLEGPGKLHDDVDGRSPAVRV